jgi:hypothetical protein
MSEILNTRKHDVTESGFLSSYERGDGGLYSVGPLRKTDIPHLKKETSIFRNVAFSRYLEFQKMDKVNKSSQSVLYTEHAVA